LSSTIFIRYCNTAADQRVAGSSVSLRPQSKLSLKLVRSPDVVIIEKGDYLSSCLCYSSHAGAIRPDASGEENSDRIREVEYSRGYGSACVVYDNDHLERRNCLMKCAGDRFKHAGPTRGWYHNGDFWTNHRTANVD
jgi:hypothetical protein